MKTIVEPGSRYFVESCPQLVACLDDTCEEIGASAAEAARSGVPVACIVLGGGYGRGEGGIWRDQQGAALHNDLDFFLFSDRPGDATLRAWVSALEKHWTERLGIHVDFACLPPQALDLAGNSMMLTDLVLGYRAVFGRAEFIEVARRRVDAARLPLWEASRLLWNRGSGLYFARCRIAEESAPNFVERNQQKLALALGDALLCLAGEHDPRVEERGRKLASLSFQHFGIDADSAEKLRSLHREAVEFKLRPGPVIPDWDRWRRRDAGLTGLWSEVFLRVESARLGHDFADLDHYARDRRQLVPESSWLRNLFIALRDRRRFGAALKPAWDYPRAALMRCLASIHDANLERALALLPPQAGPEETLEQSYTTWWQRYQ